MADMNWDEVDMGAEEVTEDDVADIESGGASVPVGVYLLPPYCCLYQ